MNKSPQVINETFPLHSIGQQLMFVKTALCIATLTEVILLEVPSSSQGIGWIQLEQGTFDIRAEMGTICLTGFSEAAASLHYFNRKDPKDKALSSRSAGEHKSETRALSDSA